MTNLETVSLSSDLISAYESLNESEKELKDVRLIMRNVQESITLLNTYGQESIKVLNADQGLENLLKISEKSMTVERVLEGFGQTMSDAWKRFVEIVKRVIDRIHVWLKTLIDKVRSTTSDLRENKLSVSLPARGYKEHKCIEATKGKGNSPFGQYVLLFDRFKRLTQAASNIQQYVEINDVNEAKRKGYELFFESLARFDHNESGYQFLWTSECTANEEDMWVSPHIYVENDDERGWFADERDYNDVRGMGLGWVKVLETAQEDLFNAIVTFDSAYEVYSKKFVKRIETEENAEKRELYQTILKGLSAASTSNGAYWATTSKIIKKMLKKYERIVVKHGEDICPRCGWQRTPGEDVCRNCGTHF